MAAREELQTKLDRRIAELRAQADIKQAEANRLHSTVNSDSAFWTQPAYSNAAGRAFARQRDRERSKVMKASAIAQEAKDMREKADAMEKRGVVMAGDAAAEREAKIASTEVQVGQIVNTVHYGLRKVLKVNAKTVLVEGSFGPLKIEKHFVRAA